jgi:hypothetical protein
VTAAERIKERECGNGEPKQRGPNCRQRETEEQAKRDALATVLANKATTDKATKLDREIAEISARLAKAPAVKETSAGKTLGSLLSLSAVSAATFQQQFFSAIVELAIAASLALPELLRPKRAPAAKREEEPAPSVEGVPDKIEAPPTPKPRLVSDQPKAGSVPDIMADLLKPAKGRRVEIEEVFKGYATECQANGERVLTPEQFIDPAQRFCRECGIRTQVIGEHIYLLDVRLARTSVTKKKGLGPMARKHGESA